MTEDKMVGWHHQLSGHESGETPGACDGQRSLACCSPWGRKESDTTEQLQSLTHMVSPVIMHGCESWTVKKAECRRIDAFELWC